MKYLWLQKRNRDFGPGKAKNNGYKFNIGVLPLCGTSFHTMVIKSYYDEKDSFFIGSHDVLQHCRSAVEGADR